MQGNFEIGNVLGRLYVAYDIAGTLEMLEAVLPTLISAAKGYPAEEITEYIRKIAPDVLRGAIQEAQVKLPQLIQAYVVKKFYPETEAVGIVAETIRLFG